MLLHLGFWHVSWQLNDIWWQQYLRKYRCLYDNLWPQLQGSTGAHDAEEVGGLAEPGRRTHCSQQENPGTHLSDFQYGFIRRRNSVFGLIKYIPMLIFLKDGNQLAHRVKCSALCAHFFNITWLSLLLLFYVFHNQKRRKEYIFSLSTPTLEYKIFPVCASCTLATSHQPAASQNTDKTELHNSDAPSCVLVAMDLPSEG